MVNRNEPNIPRHNDRNQIRSNRIEHFPSQQKNDLTPDEVIIALANTVENRRARQVIEWEYMQRRAFRVAA